METTKPPKFAYQIPRHHMLDVGVEADQQIYSKTGKITVDGVTEKVTIFFSASPATVEKLQKNSGEIIHSRRETALKIKQFISKNITLSNGGNIDEAIEKTFRSIHETYASAKNKRNTREVERSLRKTERQNPAENDKPLVQDKGRARAISVQSVEGMKIVASTVAQNIQDTVQDKLTTATSNIRVPTSIFEGLIKHPIQKQKILRVDENNVAYTYQHVMPKLQKNPGFSRPELVNKANVGAEIKTEEIYGISPKAKDNLLSQTQKKSPKESPHPPAHKTRPLTARELAGSPNLPDSIRKSGMSPDEPNGAAAGKKNETL